MIRLGVACAMFCLVFLTCLTGILSTHNEIRRYFEMPDYVGVVPDQVQSAILNHTRVGSTKDDVNRFLNSRGIDTNDNAACAARDQGAGLTCAIRAPNHFWNLIRETYVVSFNFDSGNRLLSVDVRSELGLQKRR